MYEFNSLSRNIWRRGVSLLSSIEIFVELVLDTKDFVLFNVPLSSDTSFLRLVRMCPRTVEDIVTNCNENGLSVRSLLPPLASVCYHAGVATRGVFEMCEQSSVANRHTDL